MEIFAAMGAAVERRWDAAGSDERAFAALAEALLVEHAPHAHVSLSALWEWVLFAPALPPQRRRPFGQPPIDVFVGAGFRIEANVWRDVTTTIHQHRFSGAFCMLAGESLHVRHRFEEEERINAHLRLGRLSLLDAEILAPGQVRRIESGDRLIHCALHLDRPSVSIVIRTETDVEAGPQLDYLPPFVAVDPRADPEPLRTRLDLLDTLAVTDPERHLVALERLLASSGRHVAARLLSRAFPRLGHTEAWARVEAGAASRHGAFVHRLCTSLREANRQEALIKRRNQSTDARVRLLLALLTALPSRSAIYRVIQQREPGQDPEEWVVAGVVLLSEAGLLGLTLDAISTSILRCLLRDWSLGETVTFLDERFPGAAIRSREVEVERACQNLRCSPVLKPLFIAGDGASEGA